MLVPVILSGGNGSRLWPISREAYPKPFIRFNNSLSLLQNTFQRALNIPHVKQIVTVTNADHYYQSKMELNNLPRPPQKQQFNFLLEPATKNTAAAILLSALFVQKLANSKTVLLILPIDHIITNQAKFNHCVAQAYQLAQQNLLVTFGIIPNKAETGYGYIEYSDAYNSNSYKVSKFQEKPLQTEANYFIEQGNYLWNSGIFCFSVNCLIQAIKKINPVFYLKSLHCWKLTNKTHFFISEKSSNALYLDKKSFHQLDAISIDYALMEKAKNIIVIPANFGWSEIGSWDALNKLVKPNTNGNRFIGNVIAQKTLDTTIYNKNTSQPRVIATLGVNHLLIVDTHDALLVADKGQVQNIKQLVEAVKLKNRETCQYHQTVYRPWGEYTVLEHGKNYKLKKIIVKPGRSLSLQMHYHRSEYWIVVEGIATVQNNQNRLTLKKQESTFIPIGHKHCLSNLSTKLLIVIELQLGVYLDENDIVRFKDNYGREVSYEEEASTC
jgi:mannose-1-phosphate guanylyltransferase / mannose-6-phosphate isomerase